MEKFPLQKCRKVTANENSKTKLNPKDVLCSHLCSDLLFGHNPTDRTLSASASRL
jgi:hypothetical protein